MTAPSFPHRVIIIGEPMHARAEGEEVVLYGPHLRQVATISDALRLLRELVVAICLACWARAHHRFGKRIDPVPTGADLASANPAIAPYAAKPARDAGPSVHLFAPLRRASDASAPPRTTERPDSASTNQGQIDHDFGRV